MSGHREKLAVLCPSTGAAAGFCRVDEGIGLAAEVIRGREASQAELPAIALE